MFAMNTLLHWLTSPEWALVVKTLLHSLWQGAIVAAGIALLLQRIQRPEARYRLSLAGLGLVVAAAVITWAVLNAPKAHPPEAIALPPQTVEPLPTPSGPVERIVVAAQRTPAKPQMHWPAWLALGWLIGASAMLGRASVKVAGAEQLRRSCRPLDNDRVATLVSEAKRAVKLTRQIRVAVTHQLTSPAVIGVLVPTLILPLSLITTLSPEQLRFILLHELAHIRRGDYLANLFQLFAEALLFFNPAVWWLSHQIRREREACCDALAIELSGAPADYARTLVSVAETMLHPAPAAAPAFGNEQEPSSLADRVQRALVPGYRPSLRLTWRAMLAAFVIAGVLLGLLAIGTRETVAATASLLEPKADSTPSSGGPSSSAEAYRMWQHELAIVGQVDRKESLDELLREVEQYSFADAYAAWKQETKALAEQRGTNVSYSTPTGVTDKTGKFIPSRIAALECRLGQEAHLNESFLRRELVADANLHMILESSPKLCEKYDIYSMARVEFIPGRGYTSKQNSGWSPQVQQALWLKAMTNALVQPEKDKPAMTSSGRKGIVSKLEGIHLEQVAFENTPLSEVTRFLAAEARRNDPEKEGVNFSINPTPPPVSAIDASTGLPTAPATLPSIIPTNVLITIQPAMQKVTLGEVLDMIIKVSPQPIVYSIEDYGIVIKAPETKTFTRTYKVDLNTLTQNLHGAGQMKGTNLTVNLREFFKTHGVEWSMNKSMFVNDRQGLLLVRSSQADHDIIEKALQVLYEQPLQVHIRAEFVEVPMSEGEAFLGKLDLARTNFVSQAQSDGKFSMTTNLLTGILTASQAKAAFKAFRATPGVETITAPDVTTLSGRQAQIQIVNIKTLVTGTTPLITNGVTTNLLQTTNLPFGPTLDVVPYVSAAGNTLQMILTSTVTEFLGYEKPDAALTNSAREKLQNANLPLPHYRVRQAVAQVNVWDGHTIVIGGFAAEIFTPQADGSTTKIPDPKPQKKQLLVFITPTIVDATGNRVNQPVDGIHVREP
jgi:beta-lactamase regulating signal transducer with metallopeptidase domain